MYVVPVLCFITMLLMCMWIHMDTDETLEMLKMMLSDKADEAQLV